MGRHYCDYCDIYLTHDSLNVRKAHNSGRNHQQNVVQYFMSLGTDQTQDLINRIQRQHEGGPPMGMGMGMMGGPPVMRSAGPPGFMPPPGGMGMMPPPNFNGPPQNFNAPPNFPPFQPQMMNGAPPQFSSPQRPPPQFQPASNGMQDGMGMGGPPQQQGFTNAPPAGVGAPAAASGPARPMVNPERMRMMGM